MAEPANTRIVFPSRLTEVPAVQRAIVEAVQAAGYPANSVFAIRLALDEALSNAVRHGNASDPSKSVTVDYRVSPEQVAIEIEDEGQGFCPEGVPDPTEEDNLCRPHGRGVMLMKAYMTEVRYNSRGNRVTLIKSCRCPLPNRD